ncbi:hypothetical protein Noda2021_05000 [Candidatus Dependentiae bacterium Noda2021]|nr:hypothetical protein Noda2021_05000 [Candidatus Dependentiae bacterium Noda2021]
MITVLMLYMFMASTFTFGKAALYYLQPFFFIACRMMGGGLLLLGYQYFFNNKHFKIERKDWFLFIQIIAFHIYFGYVFEYWGMQYVSSSKTCLLYNLSPFITALIVYIIYNERLSIQKWIGLTIGFVGMLPILSTQDSAEAMTQHIGIFSLPEVAILLSVVSAAYGWIVMHKLVRKHYSPVLVNGIGMLVGGFLSLITSVYMEGWPPHLYTPVQEHGYLSTALYNYLGSTFLVSFAIAVYYTLLLILIGNIICYNLYGHLLKKYSATFLSFAGFTAPLFAALFGWLLHGEVIQWQFYVSVVAVFFGLWIFYRQEL